MEENRRNFRLREFLDITWKLDDQDVSGEGTIINISSSGVLLQTDRAFKPLDHSILSFDSGEEILPFEAKKGRIVWFRQIHTPQERLQCGIEFISGNTDGGAGKFAGGS